MTEGYYFNVTYTLNRSTRTLHRRINGKSHESCNLDQVKQRAEFDELPIEERYFRCVRCFKADPDW
jgi:hypothetical protein